MKKRTAIIVASAIYIFWGLTPIYWKLLKHVTAPELLANRILWGFVFVLPLFLTRSARYEFVGLFTSQPRSVMMILIAAVLIGLNWYFFMLAMISERVLESSLAYFLTPLMVVFVGMVLLKERLNGSQIASLVLAAVGILFLFYWTQQPPWLALTLSSTFALYGYFKTRVQMSGSIGVGIENAVLSIPALIYLIKIGAHYDLKTWLLLFLSGPLTIVPLIGYARVVKAISYSTVGFLQYLSPGFQLFLATVIYQEAVSRGHQVAFGFILLALIVFTLDLFKRMRSQKRSASEAELPQSKRASVT